MPYHFPKKILGSRISLTYKRLMKILRRTWEKSKKVSKIGPKAIPGTWLLLSCVTARCTLYLYVCWCRGLRLSDLNEETTLLYLFIVIVIINSALSFWMLAEKEGEAETKPEEKKEEKKEKQYGRVYRT